MPYWQSYLSKRFLLLLSAFISLTGLSSAVLHDFHTSLAEVEYNPKSKNFEVAIRIFSDDLEKALRAANTGKKVVVDASKSSDPFVANYLQKRFSITDAKLKTGGFSFIGTELEGDVTWAYFEITGLDPRVSLSLNNQVLMEVFDDQKNIVNVKIRDSKKTFLFDKANMKFKL